jgi:teichuronic acid biosynthesis glycosyltransferase TuaG
MSSDSRVSIITPAYNAASVIGETIQSVIDQAYKDWEMLIADDCSPDDTREVVEAWCAKDSRIRLISLEKNGGPAAARNAALKAAIGRWVAFLDSDDLWLPQKLNLQVAFHKESGAKITYTSGRRISATGDVVGHRIKIPSRLLYRQLLGNTAIITSTVLVDTKLTGPVRMKETYYDDFACWLEILGAGGWAAGLDEDLIRYRISAGSVSRNKLRSAHEVWKTYRNVEEISVPMSAWYFANYAVRALLKYRRL